MTQSDRDRIRLCSISSFVMVLLLLAGVWLIPAPSAQAGLPEGLPGLVQRTAAGHVLGFQPGSLSVDGGDHAYRVEFAGASPVAPVADASTSAPGLAESFDRVSYPGLWPGISLFYDRAAGAIVRSTYLLEPGADPDIIRLRYNGPVHLEPDGSLRIEYATGRMRESAPVAWQDIDGRLVPVDVAFRLAGSLVAQREVGFSLGRYNPAYPLTIDPVLQWNTFLGGTGNDAVTDIALDGSGNIYVTGDSSSLWGTPLNDHNGGYDAFVVKLDSGGKVLWHTFLGGSGDDYGTGIAVDATGNVYVTGYSNATWGDPENSFIVEDPATDDAFLVKLDTNGGLQWHTFMGATGDDRALAVTISGNMVYVAGGSVNTWGTAPVVDHGGAVPDTFVAGLNSDNGALEWNTFMGTAGETEECLAFAITVAGNNVVVAGASTVSFSGSDGPVNAHAGGYDAFVVKLDNIGQRQWHTFLGGTGYDSAASIAMDSTGNVYMAGVSSVSWGSNPVSSFAGGISDAFAAKLNNSGNRQWHTFLGGTGYDYGSSVVTDASGNVYVGGDSSAAWRSPLNNFSGIIDAFVAKLDNNGVFRKNSFIGGTGEDYCTAIATAGDDIVYLAGISTDTWGNPVRSFSGGIFDAYAAKLHLYKFPWAMFLPALNQQ